MSVLRKAWAAAGAVGIAGSLLMATPSPASASGTLEAGAMCEAYPPTMPSNLLCFASVSGGTGPYTFSWHAISNGGFNPPATGGTVHGYCTFRFTFTYSVTVTDATHHTDTYSGWVLCNGNPI